MLGKCVECQGKEVVFSHEGDFKMKFLQWKRIKEKREIKEKVKFVMKMVKVKEYKNVSAVVELFKKDLNLFKENAFFRIHRAKQLKYLRENLVSYRLLGK